MKEPEETAGEAVIEQDSDEEGWVLRDKEITDYVAECDFTRFRVVIPIPEKYRKIAHEAVRILFDKEAEIDWSHGPIGPGLRAFNPEVDLDASPPEVRRAMEHMFQAGQHAINQEYGTVSSITDLEVRPHDDGIVVWPQSEYEEEGAEIMVTGAACLIQALQELFEAPEVKFQWAEGSKDGSVCAGAVCVTPGRDPRMITGEEWLEALTRYPGRRKTGVDAGT